MSLEDLDFSADECDCAEGAPAWMATFSDMATLLLTFFVLLLSFANLDVDNFRVALGSVKEALGVQFQIDGDFEAMATTPVELSTTPAAPKMESPAEMTKAAALVREFLRRRGMAKTTVVAAGARGVIVRIKDTVLFDPGSDDLEEAGKPALDVVADLFERFSGTLSIEGHTDDRPISNLRFPSNWELSSGRASAVLRYLATERSLDLERMHVSGYADTHPIGSNESAAGRAQNRRVEFVFEHAPEHARDPRRAFRLPFGTSPIR